MRKGLFLSLAASVTVFALTIGYRMKNPNFEIKNYQFFIALIPLLLYGLLSGQLRHLEFLGLRVESKFRNAVRSKITKKDILEMKYIDAIEKFPRKEEGRLSVLRKRPTALRFFLVDEDDEELIAKKFPICPWLDILSRSPTFKYVIFCDFSKNFKAFVPAKSIADKFTSSAGKCEAKKLIPRIIKSIKGEISESEICVELPGLVWSGQAASLSWEKCYCLKKMQDMEIDVIPVAENGKLHGVIEKPKLVASLIIDVSAKV